jgi:hypothetical protein
MSQKFYSNFISLKNLISSSVLLSGIFFSFSASAVPPGWKIDNARSNPQYRSYVKRFKEAVLYSRKHSDTGISYVFWGQFTRRTGDSYDEDEIYRYYLASVIPCFSRDLLKRDENDEDRYVIECDHSVPSEDGDDEPVSRHYVGIYKNVDYSGFIVVGDGVSYKDVADLGADPNPSREIDPDEAGKSRKKHDSLSHVPK